VLDNATSKQNELHFILLKFCLGSGGLVEMPQPFLLIYFGLLLMHVASLQ
jgi:hypothetical protein